MNRRKLLSCAGMLALLAGCGGQSVSDVIGKIPVEIKLPPELQESVNDVLAIIEKIKPIAQQAGEVSAIITKAKEMVGAITNTNAGSILSQVSEWMSPLVSLVKPYSGVVSTAIATLLPLIGGKRVTARTGMSPMQARMILRS